MVLKKENKLIFGNKRPHQIYLAWVKFQRRQVSMKKFFGFNVIFWPMKSKNKTLKLFEYVLKFYQSFLYFFELRPDVVWIQLPQIPLLWAALTYRWVVNHNARVIADCHNSMFRKPWVRMPFGVKMIKHCDLVLVHNEEMIIAAKKVGIKKDLIKVLEDAPANIASRDDGRVIADVPRPWFVFPASFSPDEPIEELLKTAVLIPEVSFLVTGNYKKGLRKEGKKWDIPSNVRLLGYLPLATFDAILCACDVVIGLTKLEGVQISVAGEAVGIGKPMVLSGTELLKSLFYKGAVFVDCSDPESIARGCLDAISRLEVLAAESGALREERQQKWEKYQAQPILDMLTETYGANDT